MDNYAVIKIAGIQYFVTPKEHLLVNRMPVEEGTEIDLETIFLTKIDGQTEIGMPSINLPAKAKVIKHLKGDKVEVYKYKSKVRYRRHIGFRPYLTEIEIISLGNLKSDNKKKSLDDSKKVSPVENSDRKTSKNKPVLEKKTTKTAVEAKKSTK